MNADPTTEMIIQPPSAIARAGPPAEPSPLTLIQAAIEKGMDPEKLGKLIDLQERMARFRAAEVFSDAIAGFQSEMPAIEKKRQADIPGKFSYKFADLGDVMEPAKPLLKKYGIAVSFHPKSSTKQGFMEVTCKLRVGIHTEETTVEIPIAALTTNATQSYGATVSYAKRFAVCAALGIVMADEDNDASKLCETLTADQIKEIEGMLTHCETDRNRWLKWLNAPNVAEIMLTDYGKAKADLERQARVKAKAKADAAAAQNGGAK